MADWRDWEIDEIPEWQASAQNILLSVCGVLLLLTGIFFLVLPSMNDVEMAKQEENLLRTQFRIKAEKVAALPDVEEQITELREFYDRLTQQLPEEDELALLLAGINDTGLQYNLHFNRLNWRAGKDIGWLYQVPLDMQLSGSYSDIGHFSAALARLPRIVALQDFQIERMDNQETELSFSVSAHTYRYVELKGDKQ